MLSSSTAYWRCTYWDSTTTAVPGHSRRMSRAARSSPSSVWLGGMRMSVTTRSGRRSATWRTISAASAALATTYLPSQKIAIAVVVTFLPGAFDSQGNYSNTSDPIFRAIGKYLAPNDAPPQPPVKS